MTYDPRKRDSTWQMIIPGCYVDPAGCGHIFPDEIVAFLQKEHPEAGFNFSREDYDLIVEGFKRELAKTGRPMRFKLLKHIREDS